MFQTDSDQHPGGTISTLRQSLPVCNNAVGLTAPNISVISVRASDEEYRQVRHAACHRLGYTLDRRGHANLVDTAPEVAGPVGRYCFSSNCAVPTSRLLRRHPPTLQSWLASTSALYVRSLRRNLARPVPVCSTREAHTGRTSTRLHGPSWACFRRSAALHSPGRVRDLAARHSSPLKADLRASTARQALAAAPTPRPGTG